MISTADDVEKRAAAAAAVWIVLDSILKSSDSSDYSLSQNIPPDNLGSSKLPLYTSPIPQLSSASTPACRNKQARRLIASSGAECLSAPHSADDPSPSPHPFLVRIQRVAGRLSVRLLLVQFSPPPPSSIAGENDKQTSKPMLPSPTILDPRSFRSPSPRNSTQPDFIRQERERERDSSSSAVRHPRNPGQFAVVIRANGRSRGHVPGEARGSGSAVDSRASDCSCAGPSPPHVVLVNLYASPAVGEAPRSKPC